jgi:amino acid adenylation domain-containing protein
MISQRNATAFVDWCSDAFTPREDDRFSSHAPFHFDLSVLDIYLSLKHGATLVLISEANGKDPVTLAALAAERRITCWYSTPSILSFLTQFGRIERHDWSALRIVHFAGEVFAVKHLRALKERVPHPRYFNLYGPTETNVCTFYEIPREIPPERAVPFPIGRPCPHYRHRVVDSEGQDVPLGQEGELWVSGPGVMMGYWNAPERDAEVFRTDARGRWYRTGDIVFEPPDGDLVFVGRRDRMVKKRGYRIELAEIEAALYRHAEVREAAVVALRDEENGVRIRAFLSFRERRPSIIQLKQFCAEHLLDYMIPDQFAVLDSLPKTSTDKTDYQALKEMP